MILLFIFTILMIAVELPVTIMYRRREDVLLLEVALVALVSEIMYMECMP